MADTNGGPLGGLENYLRAIDEQDDALDTLRADYMNDCKGPRGRIKVTMSEIREAGINIVAFREILSERRAERRHQKRLGALEDDDLHAYEDMERALGEFADTPLGEAALDRARPRGASVDEFRGD
jgi:hypothetical protein